MGRPRRVSCRICDRHIDEVGPLSARGKCETCSLDRFRENMDAMITTGGVASANWRRGMRDYARQVLAVLGDED